MTLPKESQQPEEEWAPTNKKSKGDMKVKKTKDVADDFEKIEEPITTLPVEDNDISPTEKTVEPALDLDTPLEQPADEWNDFSNKKSEDKEGKGEMKDFIEESEQSNAPPPPQDTESSREVREEIIIKEPVQENDDDWGPVPNRKSEKENKGKGKSKGTFEEPESSFTTPPSQDDLDAAIEQELPSSQEKPQEPGGEADSAPTKKSKKDKNKGKGRSFAENFETPITPDSESVDAHPEIISEPPVAEEMPRDIVGDVPQEPEDEWGITSRKKSKKDKKKHKSGLSAPAEKLIPLVEPESQRFILETNDSTPRPFVSEPLEIETSQPPIQSKEELSQEPVEEFSFVSKKSKKDKKGKKGSRVESITEPENVSPGTMTPTPEAESTTIVTVGAMDDVISTPVVEPIIAEGIDTYSGGLSGKASKQDKRKRQATVDANIVDDVGTISTPVTSWAEEVEEAEVERTIPVIDDIACDESLSHIPTATEVTLVDDFFRPNKKGKKNKKSKSIDNSRAPVSYDPSKQREEIFLPVVAAAGAIVAGAAILGESGGKSSGSSSPKGKEKAEEPEVVQPPTRKLSKKEKRKMSIDKRTPTNDIFDDDALWEGKDPKEFEERYAEVNDDVDDGGFWSPPQHEASFQTAETSFHEPNLSRGSTMQHADASRRPVMPTDRPVSPSDDMEFSRTLNQETPSASTTREVPFQQEPPSFVDPQPTDRDMSLEESPSDRNPFRNSKFGRSGFSDLPILEEEPIDFHHKDHPKPAFHASDDRNRDSAFITESPVPVQSPFAAHHENIRDSGVHLRDASPGAATRAPVSTSDAAISRLSWPSVDEETETVDLTKQQKTPDKKKTSESHRGQEFYKPLEEANRSFEVYQTKEMSNRGNELYIPKEESCKHHHEESTRDLLPSQRTSEEHRSDLHRTPTIHTRGDDKSHSQYEEKRTSIDISEPHLSSTTSKHERDKQHQKDEDKRSSIDALPSQRSREEPHVDLHRSQTIHRSGGDKPRTPHEDKTTHRDITPPNLRAINTSTVLNPTETSRKPAEESIVKKRLQRFESPELQQSPKFGGSVKERVQRLQSPDLRTTLRSPKQETEPADVERHQSPELRTPSRVSKKESYSELSHLRNPKAEQPRSISDNSNTIAAGAAIVGAAGLGFAAARQLSQEKRPSSASSIRSVSNINRLRTPNRPESVNSNRSGTPPLRRSDRKVSGDLRSLSQRSHVDLSKEAELATIASTSATGTPANPTANEGRVRAKDMADVYDGFGEGRIGSPRSPTRPHSMRRRQSMQVLDLESRVEQLAAENRMLTEAKTQAERSLQTSTTAPSSLVEKDAEIDALKRTLDWLQDEVRRLTEVNDGLTSANVTLGNQQNERYGILEAQHAQTSRELQEARDAHTHVSSGMEAIVVSQVAAQVAAAVQGKDQEIAQLRAELEATKAKIRMMQAQLLMAKTNDIDFLTVRDEDYFDHACQQLCQHVQQWVLRFSKFSDMRACRLTSEINNDKTIDRLDNAILDGSDVDSYLTDRVKRRDVFMSMTMTMVWEFIFTRYLFGMDREQRQKLKSLEKLLSEVGPAAAVHQWRATTLTLLSKREAFVNQREQDTQAVVHAIMETLSEILPPPSHLEDQIESQLKRVMKSAVDLSIEMRTQRAEYMMLPPLQPEYDANGDLASKVSFNAALMNERSGDTISNEDLENQKAVVRVVLFPLVVKKGDDRGEGEEEIVVCPAQVLVAKPKKSVRMMSPGKNLSRASMQSSMPADYNEERDEEVV
ncbi:hypothetical protein BJ875DRAFT_450068 [Amylocarpus encephaloides]|uniref:Involucrin repeat protein n=1 Tax=Amylocarpus encephaloides TaxID=45428 RepID=A0A9P7YT98_9HELO|nr:hypothetical protein BJ875DRAFT_450068 [Amylocarpus encephaloides]